MAKPELNMSLATIPIMCPGGGRRHTTPVQMTFKGTSSWRKDVYNYQCALCGRTGSVEPKSWPFSGYRVRAPGVS